jgi:hypothetical protein
MDEEFYTVSELIDFTDRAINQLVAKMKNGTPKMFGLDNRSASRLYTDGEYIAVKDREKRTLEYYGGFEYIDDSNKIHLGNYVLYSNTSERVDEAIEYFKIFEGEVDNA